MSSSKLSLKEKLFCFYFIISQNPREAAIKAGVPSHLADSFSARLLTSANISSYLSSLSSSLIAAFNSSSLFGLFRLAFGSSNDAFKLLCSSDLSSNLLNVDSLDLFNVSHVKRSKDGTFEISFFDRFKAIDSLASLFACSSASSSNSLISALQLSASSINSSPLLNSISSPPQDV